MLISAGGQLRQHRANGLITDGFCPRQERCNTVSSIIQPFTGTGPYDKLIKVENHLTSWKVYLQWEHRRLPSPSQFSPPAPRAKSLLVFPAISQQISSGSRFTLNQLFISTYIHDTNLMLVPDLNQLPKFIASKIPDNEEPAI